MFYYAIRRNMVDTLFWLACLIIGLTKSIPWWDTENGFVFVLFMCFYGVFLVYRLGVRNKLQDTLINRGKKAGVDLTDLGL